MDGLSDEFTVVAWDEPGAGRSSDLPEGFTLADYAHCLAGLIETLELAATLIMIDAYAGWKGSLPAEEVTARVAGARQMLDAPPGQFDPTFPGLFAGEPPAQFVPILAAIAGDVRPATLRHQLSLMAEADHRDLLPRIAVPTLLVWGKHDVRSPLGVAHQFDEAIPDTELVVIEDAGHVSNLDQPEQVNQAVRSFCRRHPRRPT